ncbi:MAG: DUF2812 domain-containing protein [Oscillospiraceae bacterium]|nr:DUF2812 domain-containing protein [Oscillospiraceae bacterium]
MKETKRKLVFFAPYDYDGMTNHFEEMSEAGWLIESVKGNLWKYKKIQPQKLKFAVTHFENFTFNEAAPDNGQTEFLEMCESSGWKLAAHYNSMMVFVTDIDNPVSVETDPVVQLKNIHKSVKPMFEIKNILILFNSVYRIVPRLKDMLQGSYQISYMWLLIFLAIFMVVNIDTVDYIRWYKKADAIINEQGIFYQQSTNKPIYILQAVIRYTILAICFAFFALLLWLMCYIAFSGNFLL